MLAPDVNVLVDAFREDSPHHARVVPWWRKVVASQQPFALFEPVLAGFVRVVTHPRIFDPPAPLELALDFLAAVRAQPNALVLRSGPRHFAIFESFCRAAEARGNLVADAYLAALAVEHGCTWVTSDRDYARFPGLDWRPPG
jgi:toxin-antitoxin system PIN domain toxin